MIMPISTPGIGNIDMGATATSKAKKKVEEGNIDAFASLMNMTATNDYNQVQPIDVDNEACQPDDISDINEVDELYTDYSKSDKEYSVKEAETKEQDKYSNPEDKVEVDDTVPAEDTGITVDSVITVIKQVEALVTETLDISPEQLEGLLQDMNMSIEDLLSSDNLKAFILQIKGCTEIDILINEDLSSMIKDVTLTLNDILGENNISDVSEFMALVKQLLNTSETEETLQEIPTEIIKENIISHEQPVVSDGLDVEYVVDDSNATTSTNTEAKTDKLNNSAGNVITSNITDDISNSDVAGENQGDMFGQKHSNEGADALISNLNQAIDNAVVGQANQVTYTDSVQAADIIRQIIDNIKANVSKEVTSMEVQLNPENLGRVQINVSTKDGLMQAQIIAETEAAKNAIENNIALLKEAFNNQELKVEAVEVTVATYEFFNKGENQEFEHTDKSPNQKKTGTINLDEAIMEENVTEDLQTQIEIMKAKGSRVTYSI